MVLTVEGVDEAMGGVPGKPVGTVCFAWSMGHRTYSERLVFAGDRCAVREQAVAHALDGLLRFLEQ